MSSTAFDMVLFGAGGDLALRKLFPALYRAYSENCIPADSRILATVFPAQSDAEFLATVETALVRNLAASEWRVDRWAEFSRLIHPVPLNIAEPGEDWELLAGRLREAPEKVRVFYLAIPPGLFDATCQGLAERGLVSPQSRLVVEKPLGYDAQSSRQINDAMARHFSESQIFRIDHYLGKETVQNLLALRFGNVLFEQLWSHSFIDHIQISIAETVGLENRAGFYDQTGAMRDMVQNHLLQLLCLIAMEPPNALGADTIRAEKLKVLDALRPIRGSDVERHTVRGQYGAGFIGRDPVPAYLEELGKPDSDTETYVAIRAHIDNWRWAKVPFYLRTGKRLRHRYAEIVVQFREVSHRIYDASAGALQPNRLVIRLQPDEGIHLTLMAKKMNSLAMRLQPVTLDLNLNAVSGDFKSDAYKRLMLDVVNNDARLFIHRDEVERAWAWVDPIIGHWKLAEMPPEPYPAGSWGPDSAEHLLARDGRRWVHP